MSVSSSSCTPEEFAAMHSRDPALASQKPTTAPPAALRAKVCHGGPKQHRRLLASLQPVQVERIGQAVQHLDVVDQLRVQLAVADQRLEAVVVERHDGGLLRLLASLAAREEVHPPRAALEHAAEPVSRADRPEQRAARNAKLGLDLVDELVWREARPVQLVDKREERKPAQPRNLEQLARLGLEPLGGVDQHHGIVRRSERAVRVLGKVLVARRVEHVDLLAVVLVREHRARDGDASLLLQLHEVRGGPPLLALGLDSTGLRDCATVQQELFRQRGLARVGMADDCKIATPLDLIRESDVHRDTTNVPGGG
mmetsp:Transcript_46702/g.154812  ORF Transcript_46702/g.154812 Transcript_46702/m.154812 type:complete len:312 (+) Transcript_46702:991-1926(+)